ncbi:hypothetical protein F4777DRAFT_567510 [Nemania sp. FL0916]|nr:hypothetical protein F4777DRAFT_567510 [Nemania sp. FL0916]
MCTDTIIFPLSSVEKVPMSASRSSQTWSEVAFDAPPWTSIHSRSRIDSSTLAPRTVATSMKDLELEDCSPSTPIYQNDTTAPAQMLAQTKDNSERSNIEHTQPTKRINPIQPQKAHSLCQVSGIEYDATARSSLSNSPSGLTSRTETTAQSTLSSITNDNEISPMIQPGEDPFRGPVQIPKVSLPTYIYPHSSSAINDAFQERYREVVDIFRQNTEEHQSLREHIQYIDYTLRMCGTSVEKSHPSIIVFCRPKEFKSLHSLLLSKHLKFQYCLRKSSSKYSWGGWRKNGPTVPRDTNKPLFNLYFWCQKRPRTLLGRDQIRVFIESRKSAALSKSRSGLSGVFTMCGSAISATPGGLRRSTMGCVIQIGPEIHGLTALHAVKQFNPYWTVFVAEGGYEYSDMPMHNAALLHPRKVSYNSLTAAAVSETSGSKSLPVDSDKVCKTCEDDDFIVDEVVYDDLTDDSDEDSMGENMPPNVDSPTRETLRITTGGNIETFATLPHEQDENTSNDEDLDWAIIRLQKSGPPRLNAFMDDGDPPNPIFLSEFATSCPDRETRVLIITSDPVPKSGMLQPLISFLGGINSNRASTVWSIIMSDGNSLTQGDSGALVVDAQTSIVYGHVIASNPLGEVYISPLFSILHQIKSSFQNASVQFPEPIPLLARQASFFLETKQDNRADESLSLLHGLIQSTEVKGQMAQLRSWEASIEREILANSVDRARRTRRESLSTAQLKIMYLCCSNSLTLSSRDTPITSDICNPNANVPSDHEDRVETPSNWTGDGNSGTEAVEADKANAEPLSFLDIDDEEIFNFDKFGLPATPTSPSKPLPASATGSQGARGVGLDYLQKPEDAGDDSRYDSRSRRGSPDSHRSRDTPSARMQEAAKASLIAGAAEAFRVAREPGSWESEKMKRVITGAAAHAPAKNSKRHLIEPVIGGLVRNRFLNKSRKDFEKDRSTGKSRSRSRTRSGSRSHGLGLAALATAGLGALGTKRLVENRSRSRSRSHARNYDSYSDRDSSRRRRSRSRSRSIADTAQRSLAKPIESSSLEFASDLSLCPAPPNSPSAEYPIAPEEMTGLPSRSWETEYNIHDSWWDLNNESFMRASERNQTYGHIVQETPSQPPRQPMSKAKARIDDWGEVPEPEERRRGGNRVRILDSGQLDQGDDESDDEYGFLAT